MRCENDVGTCQLPAGHPNPGSGCRDIDNERDVLVAFMKWLVGEVSIGDNQNRSDEFLVESYLRGSQQASNGR
jgi:hypothetical protein